MVLLVIPTRDALLRTSRWIALIALLSPLGCQRDPPPADTPDGAPCTRAEDCIGGFCVAGVAGSAPACTRTCAKATDCPEGWSCGAVTEQGVLVCQKGGATPFGP